MHPASLQRCLQSGDAFYAARLAPAISSHEYILAQKAEILVRFYQQMADIETRLQSLEASQGHIHDPRRDVKYNADQPRVPAGNSDGGQWTSDGGGDGSDDTGDGVSNVISALDDAISSVGNAIGSSGTFFNDLLSFLGLQDNGDGSYRIADSGDIGTDAQIDGAGTAKPDTTTPINIPLSSGGIIAGATLDTQNPLVKRGVPQFIADGNLSDAYRDFNVVATSNVQIKDDGVKIGTMKDGYTIVVRPLSVPSIDIRDPNNNNKLLYTIRYLK